MGRTLKTGNVEAAREILWICLDKLRRDLVLPRREVR